MGKISCKSFFDRLLDWLYPSICPVCGRALAPGERTICVACRWDMPLTDFWMIAENPVWRLLRERIPTLRQASALFYFRHESGFRAMIHAFKYSGRRDIAVAMGELFGRELRDSPFYDEVEVLVPVPLHWTKRIGRGFNQAEELCIGMARSMGVACDFRSLCRKRKTQTQALHRDAEARRRNVEGAFGVRHPERLAGCHILLVDDVLTTGSTIAACAEAILRAVPDVRISVATLATARKSRKK